MNWKFDFSPETSAVVQVSVRLERAGMLESPLNSGSAGR